MINLKGGDNVNKAKNIAARVKGFIKNESGVSGIVVAICLIVVGGLGAYYVYNNNLKPTLNGGQSLGNGIQSSGSTAASDWSGIQ